MPLLVPCLKESSVSARPRALASREKEIQGHKRFAASGRKERKVMKKFTPIAVLFITAELRDVDVGSRRQFEEEIGAASSENGLFIAKMEFSVRIGRKGKIQ
jgi:hypothetical protein